MQYAGTILDRLVAPEFSTLTPFSLPDVPDLPNYYGSFFLNNIFRSEYEDKSRPIIFSMLRHLNQSVKDYQGGKKKLAEFGNVKRNSNEAVAIYLRALTHFEQAIIHCDLAAGLSHGVARIFDNTTPKEHFGSGENLAEERLRFLSNAIKHFDRTVLAGKLPNNAAPVWIVTEGLRCVFETKKGGPPIVKTLDFREMAHILAELTINAKFLAEDVYRLALERRAVKNSV